MHRICMVSAVFLLISLLSPVWASVPISSVPTVLVSSAPAVLVTVDLLSVPASRITAQSVLVVDIVDTSKLSGLSYTTVLARGISDPDLTGLLSLDVVIPIKPDSLPSRSSAKVVFHAWIATVDILTNTYSLPITAEDSTLLSKTVNVIKDRPPAVQEDTCGLKYVGYQYDLEPFGEGLIDGVRFWARKSINLARFSIPVSTKGRLRYDLTDIAALMGYINGRLKDDLAIDLPVLYDDVNIPVDALATIFKFWDIHMFVPERPTSMTVNEYNSRVSGVLNAVQSQDASRQVIFLPVDYVLTNPNSRIGFGKVYAYQNLDFATNPNGICTLNPLTLSAFSTLTAQLRKLNVKAIIGQMTALESVCGDLVAQVTSSLLNNSDVWEGWIWGKAQPLDSIPTLTTCAFTDFDAAASESANGSPSTFNFFKSWVFIVICVVIAVVIMIVTGITLWLQLKIASSKRSRRESKAVKDLRKRLSQPDTRATKGRYEQPIQISFVEHSSSNQQ